MAPAPDRYKDRLFHSRMIRQPGWGGDLFEATPVVGWRETGSKSSMNRLFINIDAQDAQDYLARGFTVLSSTIVCASTRIPNTRSHAHGLLRTPTRSSKQSASPAAASRPVYPVYPVYRCSIYSPLDGSAQSRGAGARLAGKREFPKGDRPAFREVARRIPPTSPSGRHPRERGRPARMLSLRLPLSFPAMLQPPALPAGTAWARPKQRRGAAAG